MHAPRALAVAAIGALELVFALAPTLAAPFSCTYTTLAGEVSSLPLLASVFVVAAVAGLANKVVVVGS